MPKVTIKERLFLNKDQDRIVPEGDPDASFLFAAPGKAVDEDEIERLGGLPKGARKRKAESEDEGEAANAGDAAQGDASGDSSGDSGDDSGSGEASQEGGEDDEGEKGKTPKRNKLGRRGKNK